MLSICPITILSGVIYGLAIYTCPITVLSGVIYGLAILVKPTASGYNSSTGQFNLVVPDVCFIVVDSLFFFRRGVHSKRLRTVGNSDCLD
jgi:hypothetical protein